MSYEKQLDLGAIGHEDCNGDALDLGQPQKLATCENIPQFVDCDGNPVVPVAGGGGGSLWSMFSKLDDGGTGVHPEYPGSVLMGNVTAGTNNGWFVYEVCAASQPADDSNGHTWEAGPWASNSLAGSNTVTVTGSASPVCLTSPNPTYTLPDCNVADQICQVPVGTLVATDPVYAFQDDGSGNCERVEIEVVPDVVADASCARTAESVYGVKAGVAGMYGTSEQRRGAPVHTGDAALVPADDHVLLVDTSAGGVTITLTTPAACDPSIYHIKKTSTDANAVTLSPASGQIDNAASHVFSGVIGTAGENRMVFWDGANWWIL